MPRTYSLELQHYDPSWPYPSSKHVPQQKFLGGLSAYVSSYWSLRIHFIVGIQSQIPCYPLSAKRESISSNGELSGVLLREAFVGTRAFKLCSNKTLQGISCGAAINFYFCCLTIFGKAIFWTWTADPNCWKMILKLTANASNKRLLPKKGKAWKGNSTE